MIETIASCSLTKKQLCKELEIEMYQLEELISKYEIPYSEPKYRVWTKEEDDLIIKMVKNEEANYKIAYVLDRKVSQITQRKTKLKISEFKNEWTEEECKHLMFMRRQEIPYKDIQVILGRSWKACSKKHNELMRKNKENK